jgi:hypothetical protein
VTDTDSPLDGLCRFFEGCWGCDLKRKIRKDGTRGKCTHNPNHEDCPNYKPAPQEWIS